MEEDAIYIYIIGIKTWIGPVNCKYLNIIPHYIPIFLKQCCFDMGNIGTSFDMALFDDGAMYVIISKQFS